MELTMFSGSLCFSGKVLLKWVNKKARSEGDFGESNLSLSLSLLVPLENEREEFVVEEIKSLFVSVPKAKFVLWQEKLYQWSLSLADINVIKSTALHWNLWPTNITLSCTVFIIDFYITNFAKVYYY